MVLLVHPTPLVQSQALVVPLAREVEAALGSDLWEDAVAATLPLLQAEGAPSQVPEEQEVPRLARQVQSRTQPSQLALLALLGAQAVPEFLPLLWESPWRGHEARAASLSKLSHPELPHRKDPPESPGAAPLAAVFVGPVALAVQALLVASVVLF